MTRNMIRRKEFQFRKIYFSQFRNNTFQKSSHSFFWAPESGATLSNLDIKQFKTAKKKVESALLVRFHKYDMTAMI